jgi:hypothetical protein
MIDAKVADLFDQGKYFDARLFAALKHWFMRGLPSEERGATAELSDHEVAEDSLSGLAAARKMFRWRDDATEADETRKTGLGLIFWSAAANNIEALQSLAPVEGAAVTGATMTVHRYASSCTVVWQVCFVFAQRNMKVVRSESI